MVVFDDRGSMLDKRQWRGLERLVGAQIVQLDHIAERLLEGMLDHRRVFVLDPLEVKVVGGHQGYPIGAQVGFQPG